VRNYLKNKIKTKRSQPQWLMPIILAPQEVIGRIAEVQGQSWQNSLEIPSQTIKAGHGSMYLSSQLCGECNQENLSPDLPRHKCENLFKK
jgi:hypothetical protein